MSVSTISTSIPTMHWNSSIAKQRIQYDLNQITTNISDSPIIFINEIEDDFLRFEAAISGPSSTPYENGVFLLEIKLPEQYPFSPPVSIIFKRATMHPNVDEYGNFLSNLLKVEDWSPAMSIKDILEHVWARLAVPDVDSNDCDPLRAQLYKIDPQKFEETAREYSIKYAAATEST